MNDARKQQRRIRLHSTIMFSVDDNVNIFNMFSV